MQNQQPVFLIDDCILAVVTRIPDQLQELMRALFVCQVPVHHTIPARLFCVVERFVCQRHHLILRFLIRSPKRNNPNADGYDRGRIGIRVGQIEPDDAFTEAVGDDEGSTRVGLGHDDGEFLASIAGYRIMGSSYNLLQNPSNFPETIISCQMTIGIVVFFKIIYIEHDKGKDTPCSLAMKEVAA